MNDSFDELCSRVDATVQCRRENDIATLTLNRPASKNALDMTMRAELACAVSAIQRDRSVRAVIVRGAGGAFCAGGDIRGMHVADAAAGRDRVDDLHGWLTALIELDRPVIAAVDGVAYGAGFSFALVADIVIVSSRARFCMPFIKVGLVPDCAALYTLPRAVGLQRAKEILFSAREISADEACRLGIALEKVAPDRLDARAGEIAAALAHASPTMIALTKRALNTSFESDLRGVLDRESAGQGIAFSTEYHKTAARRFIDKETPLFAWPAAPAAPASGQGDGST